MFNVISFALWVIRHYSMVNITPAKHQRVCIVIVSRLASWRWAPWLLTASQSCKHGCSLELLKCYNERVLQWRQKQSYEVPQIEIKREDKLRNSFFKFQLFLRVHSLPPNRVSVDLSVSSGHMFFIHSQNTHTLVSAAGQVGPPWKGSTLRGEQRTCQ